MRLVPFGPDLPDELLEERDAGNVVFVCGAGISRPAGLPGFFDLTKKAISRLGVPEGAASITLFNRIKNDPTYPQTFDQVFGLLQPEVAARLCAAKVGEFGGDHGSVKRRDVIPLLTSDQPTASHAIAL